MERIEEAGSALTSVSRAVGQLTKHASTLSRALKVGGTALQEAFNELELSKDLDEDARGVVELFVAWREVGEAQIAMSSRLLELAANVEKDVNQIDQERSQRVSEATRLQKALEDAEREAKAPPTRPTGWLSFLQGEQPPIERDEGAVQAKLEGLRAATTAYLDHLAQQLDAAQKRSRGNLGECVNEVRRHAKGLGEKVIALRPSWRGSSGRPPASGTAKARGASPGVAGRKVGGLIKSLSTVEGRMRVKEEEEAREASKPKPIVQEAPVLLAPHAEQLGPSEWRIKGSYEHQVLKAGLRQLDSKWPIDNLLEFPRNKDGSAALFREKMLGDLLSGKIRLQSVPNNDVSAAQRDIKNLSLRQLLRLRVQHLDYTPSGCGADTVTAVGGTQEAFLHTLDSMLFQTLGEKVTSSLAEGSDGQANPPDVHRLGRDAVMFVSTAASIPKPVWWCWWLTDERRVFLNTEAFDCSASFPDGGVLEVTHDASRSDRHDPSGKLRWLDWKISHTVKESSLAEAPPNEARSVASSFAASVTSSFATPAEEGGAAPQGASASTPRAAGASTAAMVSPDILRGMRGSLRKTPSGLASPRKDSSSQESPSKESPSKESAGKESPSKESPGNEFPTKESGFSDID